MRSCSSTLEDARALVTRFVEHYNMYWFGVNGTARVEEYGS
jgi:hypothetical protein